MPPSTDGRPRPGAISAPILLGAGLALAFVILALVGSRLAARAAWLSTARRVTWQRADGTTIGPTGRDFPWTGCHGDIHFEALFEGRSAWLRCRDGDELPGGGLARVDLDAKRGRLVAAFPPDWKTTWTEGLLPGPGGALAIVVLTPGGLGAGVAGPEGWRVQPTRLPGVDVHGALLGMSFRDEALEIVVMPKERGDPGGALIVRLAAGAEPTSRPVSRETVGCALPCWFEAAYRPPGEATWRFVINAWRGPNLTVVAEDGSAPRAFDAPAVGRARDTLDLLAFGVLPSMRYPSRVLRPDGTIARRPPPAGAQESLSARRLTWDGRTLEPIPTWAAPGEPPATVQLVGGRTLAAWHAKEQARSGTPGAPGWQDERLVVADRTDPARPIESVVARSHDCADLAQGAFVPVEGGHLLFHPSGCYVTLDDAWRRRDGFGLLEHLRQRGSMYANWDEPKHVAYLAWVLFGLPISAVAAAVVGRAGGRRGAVALGVWLYVVTAGWLLNDLWWLMR